MNHQAIIQSESLRPYQNRNYMLHNLDRRHFDALNFGNFVSDLNGYCLDALDEIPAGCMSQLSQHPAQRYTIRSVDLSEQKELDKLAKRLIDEILAEISKVNSEKD